MKIERVKIADLNPVEKNTRIHTRKQIEELIRSYKMFGQIRPVVIDENNVIWCGNGLYAAMEEAGETEIDAYRVTGMSENDKKKLMLADNQIYAIGANNTVVLDEILAELDDFDVPGYDQATLQQLYGDLEEAASELSSYGVVDDEDVEFLTSTQTERQSVEEQLVYTPSEQPKEEVHADESLPSNIEFSNGMLNVPVDKDTRPFIVCPRCGEKIWV